MAQKYTLNASGSSFLRLCADPIQLSDGTLVFLYKKGASDATLPTLAYTVDRATVVDIATLASPFSAAAAVSDRDYAIARDASDNLFVVGGSTSSSFAVTVQAFVKGSGRAWTPQTARSSAAVGSLSLAGKAAVWCNTGGGTGGKGHLLVDSAVNGGSINPAHWIFDAGALLAGMLTTTESGTGAACLGGNHNAKYGADLSPDGFGAASGLALRGGSGGTLFFVGSWAVSSSGTSSGSTLGTVTASTADVTARAVRYAANAWVLITPNSDGASYDASRWSSTAQLTAPVNCGSPTGLAKNSVYHCWDAFLDPTATARVWLVVLDLGVTGQIQRVPIDASAGITWGSTATVDDTLTMVTGFGENPHLHITKRPVSAVDYLADVKTASTPTYAGVGDYVQLNQPPNAPTLTGPASGSTIDRSITQRFTWTFSDPDAGDTQSKFDLRYSSDGGSTWTTVSGTTTNQYVDIASGTFAAGSYQWQVRTYDRLGAPSPWSASSFFTAATPPAAVTITAPTSGGTIGAGRFDVTWSAPSQTDYQVRVVKDTAGSADTSTIYSDTGDVVDTTSRVRTMPFPNNGIYVHVQVRIKAGGLWSSWTDVRVLVSYTPPATPTVAVAVVQVDGKDVALQVTPTHPAPSGSQPTVAYVDIYRRVAGDTGSGSRYATEQAASDTWTDYRVASGQAYEYRVLAVGDNGTATYSAWTT